MDPELVRLQEEEEQNKSNTWDIEVIQKATLRVRFDQEVTEQEAILKFEEGHYEDLIGVDRNTERVLNAT